MSKGFLIFARNANNINYLEQAYALALSIKYSQKTVNSVSLVTDDQVPSHYTQVFDSIVPLTNASEKTRFETESRWKLFHVSPYDETIVLDADMLLTEDVSYWWEYADKFDLHFCSRIKNYKLETVVDTVHRRDFIRNNLSNPYFALHYFKKRDLSLEFYNTLKFVIRNWHQMYRNFLPALRQDIPSMDLASALTIKIMAIEDQVYDVCSPFEFVHMKPMIQGWPNPPADWKEAVHYNITTKGNLVVGNIKQPPLFHYVDKEFITPATILKLEELTHGS
jgi:hypothetical protein